MSAACIQCFHLTCQWTATPCWRAASRAGSRDLPGKAHSGAGHGTLAQAYSPACTLASTLGRAPLTQAVPPSSVTGREDNREVPGSLDTCCPWPQDTDGERAPCRLLHTHHAPSTFWAASLILHKQPQGGFVSVLGCLEPLFTSGAAHVPEVGCAAAALPVDEDSCAEHRFPRQPQIPLFSLAQTWLSESSPRTRSSLNGVTIPYPITASSWTCLNYAASRK